MFMTKRELLHSYNELTGEERKILTRNADKVADIGYCYHVLDMMKDYVKKELELTYLLKGIYQEEELIKVRKSLVEKHILLANHILEEIDKIMDYLIQKEKEIDND